MPYLIDTNIAIHAIDGLDAVTTKFAEHAGDVMISALSVVELYRGLYRGAVDRAAAQLRIDAFLEIIPTIPFELTGADAYSQIIAQLGWVRGRDFDRMIAAHAIAADCTLVTANLDDFRDIPGLSLENWAG